MSREMRSLVEEIEEVRSLHAVWTTLNRLQKEYEVSPRCRWHQESVKGIFQGYYGECSVTVLVMTLKNLYILK